MNPDFPPIPLNDPSTRLRRRQKPPMPVFPGLIEKRLQISQSLRAQIAPISKVLRGLTEAQRKAVFVKLQLERPITQQDLSGTGLKIFATPTQDEALVVPRDSDLDRFEDVVRAFGEQELKPKAPPVAAKLVSSLEGVALGDPKDRLSIGLRSSYGHLIKRKSITFELEIVTFENGALKRKADLEKNLEALRRALGNGVSGGIYDADFGESGARVCLWATGAMFRILVESTDWQQVISFFEERPEFETFHTTLSDFNVANLGLITPPPQDAPTICVIDTGVAPGNAFLAPVVRKELCRSYVVGEEDNPWDQNGHGSGVASLAAYYSLNLAKGAVHEGKAWIASAKILNANGKMDEVVGEDPDKDRDREARLLSSLLKEIVADFRPHGVRIFVLSFSILNRVWNKAGKAVIPRASWLARAIDQICRTEDVVFIGITGNLDRNHVRELHSANPFPKYLGDDSAKVLDPGHAALALTVGSVAHTAKVAGSASVPLALEGQPSPFTREGPGLGGALKPDFVERGGNFVYDKTLRRVSTNVQTDVVMASGQVSPAVNLDSGTSFAAPRVAHQVALIQYDLLKLGITDPSSPLLKALLVNSASFDALHDANWFETQFPQKDWFNVIGYGQPAGVEAVNCDEHKPILYYSGAMLPDRVAFFDLSLPVEFASRKGEKRISVSVAYAPPIQQYGLQSYLGVTLKFRLFPGDKSRASVQDAMSLDDGEANELKDQEDDISGGTIGVRRRSRGCLQHDVFRIHEYDSSWTTHPFTLAIAMTEKWGGATKPVPYAVAVKVQDVRKSATHVYSSIAQSLARARVQATR